MQQNDSLADGKVLVSEFSSAFTQPVAGRTYQRIRALVDRYATLTNEQVTSKWPPLANHMVCAAE